MKNMRHEEYGIIEIKEDVGLRIESGGPLVRTKE